MLIGLTGGIGSGKSTVASLFESLGARIIDTDKISRELTAEGGEAIAAIRDTFGSSFIDASGALDRAKMRSLIFFQADKKKSLENILHPLILGEARKLASAATSAPYSLLVVPLMFEVPGYTEWLQRILLVDCTEALQISRTMARSNLDRDTVLAMMAQQASRALRLSRADDVIQNNDSINHLTTQVAVLHARYLHMAAGSD